MDTSRTRLLAITGATLALVVASTAVTAAHGRNDDRGYGFRAGPGRFLEPFGLGQLGHLGPLGPLGGRGLGMGIVGLSDGFVRSETTLDLGDDGIVTHRADNGSVTGASDAGLDYTLATGEPASVTIGEDTVVVALAEVSSDTGLHSFRRAWVSAEEIAPADIAVGSEVIVSATSQEDGSFVADRIVVKPTAEDADVAEAAETTEGTGDEATSDATEGVEAATDA